MRSHIFGISGIRKSSGKQGFKIGRFAVKKMVKGAVVLIFNSRLALISVH